MKIKFYALCSQTGGVGNMEDITKPVFQWMTNCKYWKGVNSAPACSLGSSTIIWIQLLTILVDNRELIKYQRKIDRPAIVLEFYVAPKII